MWHLQMCITVKCQSPALERKFKLDLKSDGDSHHHFGDVTTFTYKVTPMRRHADVRISIVMLSLAFDS